MPPKARQLLTGAGVGLLCGAAGAAVCAAVFTAVYRPHGGGQIGDWTGFIVAAGSFVIGIPLGIAAGIALSFSSRPHWHLAAGLCTLGLVSALALLAGAR